MLRMFWTALITVLLVTVNSAVYSDEIASHYGAGDGYYGKPVACPGYGNHKPGDTTAHRTLPCGTRVEITNPKNGKSVVVTVTDRGPFVKGRTWDLNSSVTKKLGLGDLAPVQSKVLGK